MKTPTQPTLKAEKAAKQAADKVEKAPKQSAPKTEKAPKQAKADKAPAEPAKKKFGPRTKTLAEFEAEEQAFQARLAREKKERNTISGMGALAGEKIMDATARLLAPRAKSAITPEKSAQKEGKKGNAKAAGQSAEKSRRSSTKTAQKAASAPVKQEKKSGMKTDSAKNKNSRPRRDRGPRPVEMRPRTIKDSTEQPSLMKPFYLGQDD